MKKVCLKTIKVSFRKTDLSEKETETRFSRAFALLFEEVAKKMTEEELLTCFDSKERHNEVGRN
jgi:hypothetical protein